ncbi:stress response protein NST1-like [Drosophila miranda]|uniref:stress response protein NST1-like n=1 Tax=Drosophila miranda TaxID=7229 RepID=UPI00143F063B|nr:stress response protein NST1-like [Drosophila miranda]
MHLHAAPTTTPLPLLMSTTGGLYTAAKAKSSPAIAQRLAEEASSPSFHSFKLNQDRSLADKDAIDVEVDDQDTDMDAEEHDEHEHEHEHEHEAESDGDVEGDDHDGDNDSFSEHARELIGDGEGDDIKEHVFPLHDNELHHEMHSIEEVQQQLQHHDDDAAPAPAAAAEESASEALPSSTESPAATAIEERIKQIAQDFQKMASSQEMQTPPKEEVRPSIALAERPDTHLRPNEQRSYPRSTPTTRTPCGSGQTLCPTTSFPTALASISIH